MRLIRLDVAFVSILENNLMLDLEFSMDIRIIILQNNLCMLHFVT
jgi:hypothetical protein